MLSEINREFNGDVKHIDGGARFLSADVKQDPLTVKLLNFAMPS